MSIFPPEKTAQPYIRDVCQHAAVRSRGIPGRKNSVFRYIRPFELPNRLAAAPADHIGGSMFSAIRSVQEQRLSHVESARRTLFLNSENSSSYRNYAVFIAKKRTLSFQKAPAITSRRISVFNWPLYKHKPLCTSFALRLKPSAHRNMVVTSFAKRFALDKDHPSGFETIFPSQYPLNAEQNLSAVTVRRESISKQSAIRITL